MSKARKTKLIRDRYQDLITPEDWVRMGSGSPKHLRELHRKLQEEVDELKSSNYLSIEEYADIIEVLKCLCFFHNINWNDVEDAIWAKQNKYGKFLEGLLLVNIPEKEKDS